MNATGGWTAINEELDATSTNPVQNKTLYNLETYHTLTPTNISGGFKIDDGSFPFKIGNSVKLFFNEDFSLLGPYYLSIEVEPNKYQQVWFTSKKTFEINLGGPYSSDGDEKTYQTDNSLHYHSVLTGFNSKGEPNYNNICIAKGTTIELILTSDKYGDKSWAIVGNPVVGRYQYNFKYFTAPPWNITANAVVYANGLKIQWGNFTVHSTSEAKETYFLVKFEDTPSMSVTFNTNNGEELHYDNMPFAASSTKWQIYSGYQMDKGTWIAIGY